MAGILEMMGHIQSEGERGKQAGMSRLIGKAYNDPSQRQAALGRVAQLDGPAAFNAQAMFEKMDDTGRQRLGQRMAVFSALPDDIKAQAYPDIAREAQALGIPAPGEWNPEFAPHMQKIAQALSGGGQQTNVHSAFRGQNGNMWVLGRDGQVRDTGAQFDPSNQIMDTGNGIFGINKSNLQAAPVMIGGQGQPAQQQAPSGPMTASTGQRVNIDPSLPENVRASIMAAENAGQPLPGVMVGEGQPNPQNIPTSMGMPAFQGAPAQGQQLRSAPKPSEALAIANFNAKQARTLNPQEVAAAGFRPGTIVEEDGFGNRKVLQQPAAAPNQAANKEAAKARQKIPQLKNAVRGVQRIGEALGKLSGSMVNTGPLDQYAQKFTKEGQELEAAVGAIQNSVLALTRVPGVGSQSDLEQRVAMLQYPALDKAPEVNARTLENLKLFMQDLEAAYDNVTSGRGGEAPASGGVDDLLSKYGIR